MCLTKSVKITKIAKNALVSNTVKRASENLLNTPWTLLLEKFSNAKQKEDHANANFVNAIKSLHKVKSNFPSDRLG